MKKLVIGFLIVVFLLTGCSVGEMSSHQHLEEPELTRSPLEGRWIITGIFNDGNIEAQIKSEEKDRENLIGKDIIFQPQFLIINGELRDNLQYKFKKLNADRYLNMRYNIDRTALSIKNESIYIIYITSENKDIFQVAREKEDIAYINIYGTIYQLAKTKEPLSQQQIETYIDEAEETEKYYSSPIERLGG